MIPFLLDKDSMCTDNIKIWGELWKSHKWYGDGERTKLDIRKS